MCIRDSGWIAWVVFRDSGFDFTDQVSTNIGALGENAAAQAVSYTHLRAHETVLDLVCRLLLEKK